MIDPVLIYAASATLAGILLLGGLAKLRGFDDFLGAAGAYALLPLRLVKPFAVVFIAAELLSGAMLLAPVTRSGGALLGVMVLLVATSGIVVNLLRGRRDIDCGCGGFGGRGGGLSGWLVLRNAVLLLLALTAVFTGHASVRAFSWVDAVTFFGATLALLGMYYLSDQLIDSHTRLQNLRRLA